MINCLAIDDEPLALKQLENYIKKTPFLQLAASCHSVKEAQAYISQQSVDLIITDINMPDCSGLDFVKSLQNPPLVVFSTAYEEYALEGYKVDAIDYLLKPYGYQDFLQMSLKVKQYYEWKQAAQSEGARPVEPDDYLFVRADNKSVKVQFDHILYIEAMSEYIRIHFTDSTSIMTFMSIKLMAEALPANRFMRVHRSYIISLKHIAKMHRSEVELMDGTMLPVSASYKDELLQYISARSVERK